jgi:cytochrome c peroxidase
MACAASVLAVCALPDAARGGGVSSEREVQRLTSGERNLVELGRRLFFEPALSSLGERACSSCHEPEHGFGDPRRRSPEDVGRTQRHSQSLIDVDLKSDQHWDGEFLTVAALVKQRATTPSTPEGYGSSDGPTTGRRTPRVPTTRIGFDFDADFDLEGMDVEDLEAGPSPEADLGLLGDVRFRSSAVRHFLKNPVVEGEMVFVVPEMTDGADGAERVQAHARYLEALTGAGPGRLDTALAGRAIEAYVGTLRSSRSPYDRFRAGESEALSASAQRGLELFRGRAGCAACHKEEGPKGWPVFRDGDYHNNGIAWMSKDKQARLGVRALGLRGQALEGVIPELNQVAPEPDDGRGRFLAGDANQRAFKTPSLRDVARHPPYMHDGSKPTLADVVAHYASGCGDDPGRDARLKGFEASEQDQQDLVAFLHSLTSEERPGRVTEVWKKRAARTRLRFLDALGEPVVGLEIGLEQTGEVVPVEGAAPLPTSVVTDARGEVAYVAPGSTHVRLKLPVGLEPEGGTLVPDTCGSAVIVLPRGGPLRLALIVGDAEISAPDTLRAYESMASPDNFGPTSGRAVRATPWTLSRTGTVDLGGQRAVLYEGHRMGAGRRTIVFRLPGQTAPQEVALDPEDAANVATATQRVAVIREGSPGWRQSAK